MQGHNAGQKLTAVQNDNVYKTVPFYQGPIINLVATQRLAQQLYGIEGRPVRPAGGQRHRQRRLLGERSVELREAGARSGRPGIDALESESLKYATLLLTVVSKQVQQVDTIFCHETGGDFLVVVERDGKRLFRAKLELSETSAGPRPAKFRLKDGSSEEPPRQPDEFVELARRSKRIRISEQTSSAGRRDLGRCSRGYQLEDKVKTVRTCRYCAGAGRYSPITTETAVKDDNDWICTDCAKQELERQLSFSGAAARSRVPPRSVSKSS